MLSKASNPVDPASQAVLFYLCCDDVEGVHRRLAEAGIAVGEIKTPFYNRSGEFRLQHRDGYLLYVAYSWAGARACGPHRCVRR